MIFKRGVFLIGVLFTSWVLSAQGTELRSLMLEQFKFNSHLTTSFDGGFYKGLIGADYARWGVRNVTSYKLSNAVSVDAGFMYNRTVTSDEVIKNEFRPHQTLKISYPCFSKMVFTHRLRMEEQIFTYNHIRENSTASRLRYEVKTKRAFNLKKSIKPKTPYWMASVEFFFNPAGKIQDEYILFNRGRHGLGLGYKLNSNTTLEGTLLYQHSHNVINFKDRTDVTIFNFYIKNSLFSKKNN